MDLLKLLEDAFEAGENYAESKTMAFASIQPSFNEWLENIEPWLAKSKAEEIVDLTLFVIKNWASLNEQNDPTHKELIQSFINNELANYVDEYEAYILKKRNELKG